MLTPFRQRLAQWLLLCAIAVGVIGMHHLTSADSGHAMSAAGGVAMAGDHASTGSAHDVTGTPAQDHATAVAAAPETPMGGHDVMHLCMAVLASSAVPLLLLLLALAAAMVLTGVVRAAAELRRRWRGPPPRTGQQVLALVSVLRL
ncbi:DUF6153 family protein [Actinokineospora bangkokensis]|uniref:Uncharacterized protein n=1 Tax=Actinokineospora bangkokensis TaxID=1193682 RepID=A0A1Q9LSR2_9PSEU|nr:DUF6153 family protein [Actinokineospora bangkokensis]OLR95058.1 hypothetical protein BJP25_08900 [Actinokineospora bangkokensis]